MATICIAESTVCQPNALQVIGGKLRARPVAAVFRVERVPYVAASLDAGDHIGAFESPIPFTVISQDTTPGMFTLMGTGCVRVNCSGVYAVKARYGSGGSSARQTGGFVRWTRAGLNIMGFDFDDLTGSINLGSSAEGPEFEASCAGIGLTAGEEICVAGRIYTAATGTVIVGANLQVTYLGETL